MKILKNIKKKMGDFVEETVKEFLFSLTITFIIFLVLISIKAYLITSIANPDSARYLLSAIIQSQAAIFAIVITITLVALQLASQTYSPKIFRKFLGKKTLRGLYLLFIFSMMFNALFLMSITEDTPTSGGTLLDREDTRASFTLGTLISSEGTLLVRDALFIPIGLFALSLGYLIFYIDPSLTNPVKNQDREAYYPSKIN